WPSALDVDRDGGKVYWTVATALGSTGQLQRADLDGGSVEVIVPPGPYAENPVDLSIDTVAGRIYWLDDSGDIHRANLDGSAPELFGAWPSARAIAVDPEGGHLYATSPQSERIDHWTLDGAYAGIFLDTTGSEPVDVEVDAPGGTVYWTDDSGVMAADVDGTGVRAVTPSTGASCVAVDLLEDRVFVVSPLAGVSGADLDGDDPIDLDLPGIPADIAVLASPGELRWIYWAEEDTHRVLRVSLDGSGVQELANVEATDPRGLTIDPDGGKIYWGDRFSGPGIRGANLDGSDVGVVVPGAGDTSTVIWSSAGANWVYWFDDPKFYRGLVDTGYIEELGHLRLSSCIGCNDDFRLKTSFPSFFYSTDRLAGQIVRLHPLGGTPEVLVSGIEPYSIELDLPAGRMYWGDETGIRSSDLDGGSVQMLVPDTFADRLALDAGSGKIYWSTLDEIWRADLDGGNARRLLHALSHPSGLALGVSPTFENKIYWTDLGNDQIRRTGLDGSAVETVVSSGLSSPQGITYDPINSKMYWTDPSADRIQRSNLDGSCVETVLDTGLNYARDIGVHWSDEKVYWVDRGANRVGRVDYDGQNFEILYTGVDDPKGMDLDRNGGKIYWGDSITNRIARGDMDGSGPIETVVSGTPHPYGVALDLVNSRVYWTDDVDNTVERAFLDGSGREILVSGLDQPLHLSLDVQVGKMYWTENAAQEIQCANLDGSGLETVVSTGSGCLGIFLLSPGTIPPVGAPEVGSASVAVASLRHPFPNPFRSGASLALQHRGGDLDLSVYDAAGRLVRVLHRGPGAPGDHLFRWDGRNRSGRAASPGVYFFRYRPEAGAARTVKGVLLR
ncbi:MAG TPA: FlgD immunoglobulin-like domain containing protein, partial [bacterium]|nr:FlgD immunoglobulin-like domain containing protein [bacterium]